MRQASVLPSYSLVVAIGAGGRDVLLDPDGLLPILAKADQTERHPSRGSGDAPSSPGARRTTPALGGPRRRCLHPIQLSGRREVVPRDGGLRPLCRPRAVNRADAVPPPTPRRVSAGAHRLKRPFRIPMHLRGRGAECDRLEEVGERLVVRDHPGSGQRRPRLGDDGPEGRGPVGAPAGRATEPTASPVDDVPGERPRVRRRRVRGADHARGELARVVAPDVVLEQFGVPAAGGGCARGTGPGRREPAEGC
jgi:hypothetical protein